MNPIEKQEMLQFIGDIPAHIQDREALLENMVLQRTIDIEQLKGRRESLTLRKAGICIEDEGDAACETIDAVLNQLSALIAHLEHMVEELKLAIRADRAANRELNGFVNALTAIPNRD